MAALIEDILDFSKIQFKKLELNLETFAFETLVDEVFEMFSHQA